MEQKSCLVLIPLKPSLEWQRWPLERPFWPHQLKTLRRYQTSILTPGSYRTPVLGRGGHEECQVRVEHTSQLHTHSQLGNLWIACCVIQPEGHNGVIAVSLVDQQGDTLLYSWLNHVSAQTVPLIWLGILYLIARLLLLVLEVVFWLRISAEYLFSSLELCFVLPFDLFQFGGCVKHFFKKMEILSKHFLNNYRKVEVAENII